MAKPGIWRQTQEKIRCIILFRIKVALLFFSPPKKRAAHIGGPHVGGNVPELSRSAATPAPHSRPETSYMEYVPLSLFLSLYIYRS